MYVYGDISKEDYERQRDELQRQIISHRAQQVQPYEIDELLSRLEIIGERITAADRQTQEQLIAALFTRLEANKNDAGDWVISSGVV